METKPLARTAIMGGQGGAVGSCRKFWAGVVAFPYATVFWMFVMFLQVSMLTDSMPVSASAPSGVRHLLMKQDSFA
jgi:hypothetical protein